MWVAQAALLKVALRVWHLEKLRKVVESEHQTECSSFGAREYVDV